MQRGSHKLDSVSISSSSQYLDEEFWEACGRDLDVVAIFCNSFDSASNVALGWSRKQYLKSLHRVTLHCISYNITLKLNTIHTEDSVRRDRAAIIDILDMFNHTSVNSNIQSDDATRRAHKFRTFSEGFQQDCGDKHDGIPFFVPINKFLEAPRYFIVDDHMRFVGTPPGIITESILDIGVKEALKSLAQSEEGFVELMRRNH